MGKVVPFPIVRRQAFIERQAWRAAELSPDAGERHIQQQIKLQIAAMRRKGVAEELIAAEARMMESAIRAALWKSVLGRPGGGL
ncbi:MAG: hypothetical protein HY852_00415 [Bradyrhizobium sp.]|uniref:DUF6074 family protein n=1 Tax=Bradyrhizobium sp. TaxID=376 RepID=UPI0025BAF6E7|nr:DUF6074 family protein [Bradyrhizobium sp.]MBI5260264.1 hypothetical protein [Bradyrhizobium sp.]